MALTSKEEVQIILEQAKENSWKVYKEDRRNFRIKFNMVNLSSNEMPDLKNFHVVTDVGLIIKRREIFNRINPINHWELRMLDSSLLVGTYKDITTKFVEEYNKRVDELMVKDLVLI